MTPVDTSFVIPTLNEEENIGETIRSIQSTAQRSSLTHEIIVVDHGSTDSTREIARSLGALVIQHTGGTIGNLRNIGAQKAKGTAIVFIDADVTLTNEWAMHILPAINSICKSKLITGSHCSPPDSNNIFLKHWFSSFANDPRNTHLGTGHMIISKKNFMELGGFDSELRTGEDYDFCARALDKGFKIENKPELKVVHHDFPVTTKSFIKREAWHGQGDIQSLQAALKSKVVMGSMAFTLIHIVIILSILFQSWSTTLASIGALITLLFLSSLTKNSHAKPETIFYNTVIFYPYYVGRSLALLKSNYKSH